MNLYLIKTLGIILVIICCIIATYTDVKRQIIPNKLTFTTLILGIILVSTYYMVIKEFNPIYYLSILLVYLLSYILWRLGVWAGGDVKLLTAISALLIPEFLDVLPNFTVYGLSFPFYLAEFSIPTLILVFNSIISIIPVVLIYVSIKIIKHKPYLKEELFKSFNFKEAFISLNSLFIAYVSISPINIHPIIKIIVMLVLSYILSKIIKHDIILTIVTITLIIQQIYSGNIFYYLSEFILILILITIRYIHQKRIIKEALTENIEINDLEEGMILQYPLYYKDKEYYFNKSPWYDLEQKGKLICSNNARGINTEEIQILKECFNSTVSIKKGLPFAPFILAGLILTLTIGNTYQLLIFLMELI